MRIPSNGVIKFKLSHIQLSSSETREKKFKKLIHRFESELYVIFKTPKKKNTFNGKNDLIS